MESFGQRGRGARRRSAHGGSGLTAPGLSGKATGLSKMRKKIILALVLAIGAYLRLHNLDWGLPDVFEEATPWRQAWQMWGFGSGGLDFNPHFFHYPAFTFYIQWFGQALIYLAGRVSGAFASPDQMQAAIENSPYRFIVMGRLITSLFGIASIYLVYRLGRDLYSAAAGMLAALFLALNFSHISRGQSITTDIPLVFFILLAFVPILKVASEGNRKHYLWAGIAVGLATGVKYPGLLTGTGIVAAHVLYHLKRKHTWRRIVLSRSLWLSAGAALLAFFAVSPYCLIDYSGFYRDLRFEQVHMEVGHFGAPDRLVSYGEYLLSIIPGILTLPLLGLTVAGIGYGLRREPGFSMMILAFPLVYIAVVGSWKTAADHYILPVLPFLLLFAALPLWKLYDRVSFRWKELLLGLVACLFVLPSVVAIHEYLARSETKDNRTLARTWIERNIHKGAAIAKERITPALDSEDYLVFELPLSTVYPKETEAFYDLRLYSDFDYIITSSEVYKRYLRNPGEYPVHARFYKQLEESGSPIKQFDETTGSGPDLDIYSTARLPDETLFEDITRELYPSLIESADPRVTAGNLCNLAIVLSRKHSYAKAIELYQLALAVDSTFAGTWYNLGLTLFSLGRIAESENALRKTVGLDSAYAKAWLALGHFYRDTGDLESSVDAYERGLIHDPQRPDILLILSEQYSTMGRTGDALRVARRGLEVVGGSHEFHFALGRIHMMREEHEEAVRSLRKAVEARPQDGRYAYSLASAYYSVQDYGQALRYARKAAQLGYDTGNLIEMIEEAAPSGPR
jgi:tetratricopeptide (TPR) repeat protein